MTIGLGTGTTAYWAIRILGERVQDGLSIQAAASSIRTEQLAKQWGIPMVALTDIERLDVTIDGADEVDSSFNLIKGGGGALLREKVLASNSRQFIVIVDESKRVQRLGRFPLPVEITPFAAAMTIARLKSLNCTPELRLENGQAYVTDNGNYIVDCQFGEIAAPDELSRRIDAIPGVVESGLFVQMASLIVVGFEDGHVEITETRGS